MPGCGCFYGLSMAAKRGDLALAVMEGVAFEITEILQKVDPENKAQRLVLFGGGAKSALWQQIFADATGKEILVPQLSEAAGVGAAILAGVGCGQFSWAQLPYMPIASGTSPGDFYRQTQVRFAAFRKLEAEIVQHYGMESGLVIATGGGCVTRDENHMHLHQNGNICWIQRDLSHLPTDGRPLSQPGKLETMYQIRKPMYERFSDFTVENAGNIQSVINEILSREVIE
jgi:hypothetical protein